MPAHSFLRPASARCAPIKPTPADSKYRIELVYNKDGAPAFTAADGSALTMEEILNRIPSLSDPDAKFVPKRGLGSGALQTVANAVADKVKCDYDWEEE